MCLPLCVCMCIYICGAADLSSVRPHVTFFFPCSSTECKKLSNWLCVAPSLHKTSQTSLRSASWLAPDISLKNSQNWVGAVCEASCSFPFKLKKEKVYKHNEASSLRIKSLNSEAHPVESVSSQPSLDSDSQWPLKVPKKAQQSHKSQPGKHVGQKTLMPLLCCVCSGNDRLLSRPYWFWAQLQAVRGWSRAVLYRRGVTCSSSSPGVSWQKNKQVTGGAHF